MSVPHNTTLEPCREKPCIWHLPPGPTQTGLYTATQYGCGLKFRIKEEEELYYLKYVAKSKTLVSCTDLHDFGPNVIPCLDTTCPTNLSLTQEYFDGLSFKIAGLCRIK